jgi:hypothetical protein
LQRSSDTPASTDDNGFVALYALRGLYDKEGVARPPRK